MKPLVHGLFLVVLVLLLPATGLAQTVITLGPAAEDDVRDGDGDVAPPAAFEPGTDGGYVATGAAMDVAMPRDVGRDAIVVAYPSDAAASTTTTTTLRMEHVAAVQRDAEGAELVRRLPQAATSAARLVDPQTVRYMEIYPGVDDEYRLSHAQLKHDWILQAQPALPASAAWYGYEVRLTLPEDATLEAHGEGYVVVGGEGDALYELAPVVALDAAGREVAGQYRMLDANGTEITLAVEVAAQWLVTASYPVRIDPTIITVDGPTITWNSFPWNNSDPWTYQQTYSAAQLQNTAGLIERIGFYHRDQFNKTWDPARIYMGETSYNSATRSNTFDDNFDVVSKTLVYDGTLSMSQTSGPDYVMIPLQTPFYYSGQNTLVIQIELGANPSGTGISSVSRESGSSTAPIECYRLYSRASSSATTGSASTSYYYLHTRFEIQGGPSIDTTSLPGGTEGFAYSATLQASGGATPYAWSQTGLPVGLTLDPSSGEITGTPDASDVGSHSVTITVTDANNETDDDTFSLEIDPAVSVDPVVLPEGTETGDYPSVTPTTSGGAGPFAWSADGLPAGLDINATTGEISGTVEAGTEGSHTVEITATDTNSDSDTYITTLEVNPPPQIILDTLPQVTPNEPWGPYLIEHQGGTAPLTFSAVDLPEGLTLNAATGEVSGQVEPGIITSETRFEATVTDANGVTHAQEIGFVTHTIGAGSSTGCDCTTMAPHLAASNAPWLLLLLLALFVWRRRLAG